MGFGLFSPLQSLYSGSEREREGLSTLRPTLLLWENSDKGSTVGKLLHDLEAAPEALQLASVLVRMGRPRISPPPLPRRDEGGRSTPGAPHRQVLEEVAEEVERLRE